MYVSVPKNYSGIAFSREMPRSEHAPHENRCDDRCEEKRDDRCEEKREDRCEEKHDRCEPPHEPPRHEHEQECDCKRGGMPAQCDNCRADSKNPLSCLINALRNRGKAGFDTEDFLLIGLIALMMGKDGNEDMLLILAMLLLV